VLLVDAVNPVFGTPAAWRIRDRLRQIPFIASFASFVDDTSVHADLILPDHSFLESWVDGVPESGSLVAVANVAAPVMRPLHQSRATPDVIIEVAAKLTPSIGLPWKSYEEMLKASFEKLPPGADAAWAGVEKQGGWWGDLADAGRPDVAGRRAPAPAVATGPPQFDEPRFDGDPERYPFHLQPYASQAFADGSAAHLPWLQELPDPLTSAMWSSWVEINPQTAAKLQIAQGDLVDVRSSQGSIRAPAIISPGIAPDVVGMPVGQGHGTFTRYASGRGVNPVSILAPLAEQVTGALAWAATRVQIARAGDADGSLVTFAGEMRESPREHETR
jgi:anaerobic selenocysteine-containing dehydrogenase